MIESPRITALYSLLVLFQFLHILEEIGLEAYRELGSLKRYLKVAGVLVTVNFVPLLMMLLEIPGSLVLGLVGASMGIGNGVVHVVGYLKTRSIRGTVGAGVFTSIPLGMIGVIVLCQLIATLLR
jgi:hypothetical protein